MSQQQAPARGRNIFPKWSNLVLPGVLLAVVAGAPYKVLLVGLGAAPTTINVGFAPEQPIAYSHALHAGQLGIDCRYCHTTVEKAAFAAIPPTETCMNCHHSVRHKRPEIQKLRSYFYETDPKSQVVSDRAGQPIPWVKVHDLPDYAYFNHSAHVNKGVGCVSCHGRVDKMEVVFTQEPLSMGWCLKCHRDPTPNLRPREDVTNMGWGLDLKEDEVARLHAIGFTEAKTGADLSESDRRAIGKLLFDRYQIRDRIEMADCSRCHR